MDLLVRSLLHQRMPIMIEVIAIQIIQICGFVSAGFGFGIALGLGMWLTGVKMVVATLDKTGSKADV